MSKYGHPLLGEPIPVHLLAQVGGLFFCVFVVYYKLQLVHIVMVWVLGTSLTSRGSKQPTHPGRAESAGFYFVLNMV